MKLAVLFAGQGSQYPGMGEDFIKSFPNLADKLTKYSKILNLDLKTLLNDESKVNDTKYTQPLMVSIQMLIHDYLANELKLKVSGYAGFSLGEITALYASGFYNEFSILNITNERARLMNYASDNSNGKMAAILGLDDQVIEEVCSLVSNDLEMVVAANYNSPGQLVISGSAKKIEEVLPLLKDKGARRAILLNVSGAFHSPYMKECGLSLKEYAKDFEILTPKNIIYRNTNALPLYKNEVLEELATQVFSPVYFKQTIENMIKDGFTHFLEIGPGNVLSGLVRKINKDVTVYNVSKVENLEQIKEIL